MDRNDTVELRLKNLESQVETLLEVVDGRQDWSHRKRLHRLEQDAYAAKLAGAALAEWRSQQTSRHTRVREWAAFVLAAGAIVLTFYDRLG